MPAFETRERVYIRDMAPNERVSGPFAIANAQIGRTRQDKPYLRCLLSDRTGEVAGRMWSIDEATFSRLPTDGFVHIEGETQPYQGQLQLIIHSIDPVEPTPEQMRELMPVSEHNPEEMFAEVREILGTLEHPAMKALAELYLEDEFLMEQFRQAPAAKAMHHAYLGGLVEHTLSLLRVASAVCPLYPKINRDIVLMGLFIHDIGKTRELVYDKTFTYSDAGELVGHIVEGAHILREKCDRLMREKGVRPPQGMALVLEHIVLSHHGVPEYGAAKIPMTPEAIMVSMLDNLDAKTAMALAATRPDHEQNFDLGGNFTEKNWALGVRLYRPDPLKG